MQGIDERDKNLARKCEYKKEYLSECYWKFGISDPSGEKVNWAWETSMVSSLFSASIDSSGGEFSYLSGAVSGRAKALGVAQIEEEK